MKRTSLIFVTLAVMIVDLRVEGFPQSQSDPDYTVVDGFAFDGAADRGDVPLSRPDRPSMGRLVPSTTTVRTTPTVAVTDATTPVSVAECLRNCRFQVTSEYNPVCGTNQQVYNNPGLLACAKDCGVAVEQARFGKCTSTIRG